DGSVVRPHPRHAGDRLHGGLSRAPVDGLRRSLGARRSRAGGRSARRGDSGLVASYACCLLSYGLEARMRLRSSLSGRLLVASTIAVFAALAGPAFAGSAREAASITSLTVTGGPANPIFTITGSGLTVPNPNPAKSPANQPLCPVSISGDAGFDYGTLFYMVAWEAQPNDTNIQMYAAGRYRPKLNELDCIGIVVTSHTATRVTFTLGHGYVQYYTAKPRLIHRGDVVEVVLKGAAFA